MPIFSTSGRPGVELSGAATTGGPGNRTARRYVHRPDARAVAPTRHDLRRTHLRRRRGDGRRPACQRRATSSRHRTMEKVVEADRHSGVAIAGVGGRGDGDDPAVPVAARALREGRRHRGEPGGQGQSAVDDGPWQSAGSDAWAWSWCQSSVATTFVASAGGCGTTTRTGGRYEERDYVATGWGSLHAGTVDQGRFPSST